MEMSTTLRIAGVFFLSFLYFSVPNPSEEWFTDAWLMKQKKKSGRNFKSAMKT